MDVDWQSEATVWAAEALEWADTFDAAMHATSGDARLDAWRRRSLLLANDVREEEDVD